MTLWTATDAATATGGRAQGDWAVTGFGIDSRAIAPGQMFVALTAARDGHDFVRAALDTGASAALVSRFPEGCEDAPLLLVEDVQTALEALGRAARARSQARVIAVTGSVGKTSTKEMLRHCLAAQGRTHAAIKSYNNHWGVPLTLAAIPPDADYAVVEIGMNHPGEIAPLSRMARPHVAMVTTVAPVHLEGFPEDGIDGIAREKASIFEGLEEGGAAIWNADVDTAPILAEQGNVSFGAKPGADWTLTDHSTSADAVTCAAQTPLGPLTFRIGTPGAHFATNALAVLAACHAVGADVARAALSLSDWSPPDGRGRRHAIHLHPDAAPLDLIDDAYNANPASVSAALDLLAASAAAPRIAILGDMKELGPTGPDLHAALAAHPAMAHLRVVHTVGPLMAHLHTALPPNRRGEHVEAASDLLPLIRDSLTPGAVVLIKGSLSMKMSMLVDGLRALDAAEE